MDNRNRNFLISYKTLRQLIGVLGILLPFLCWGVNVLINRLGLLTNPLFIDKSQTLPYKAGTDLKDSISFFYYTTSGPLYVGILVTVAIFLFCYFGYPMNKTDDRFAWLTDRRVATFAACCALGLVIFPTNSVQKITDNIHIFVVGPLIGRIHLVFAALFFISMAVMSIINFRRMPGKKLLNNREGILYLVCGWGIILCLLLLVVYGLSADGDKWLWGKPVYVLEVLMVGFFGTAWLVKGKSVPTEFILKKLEH
ncbi:MAG: hypothetical protein J5I50_12705 [Chitinophagaceae bacterium]|nr:hypothetical protein [Chitinophagaceae bacterium]